MNISLWCDLEVETDLRGGKLIIKEGEVITVTLINSRIATFVYEGNEYKVAPSVLLLAGKRF